MIQSKTLRTVLSVCLLAAVLVLIGGCDDEGDDLPVYKVKGVLTVSYSLDVSGGTVNPIEAREILMFEEYVVIKKKTGASELIPIDKIQKLVWAKE